MLIGVDCYETDRISREVSKSTILINTEQIVYGVPGTMEDGEGKNYEFVQVTMINGDTFFVDLAHLKTASSLE